MKGEIDDENALIEAAIAEQEAKAVRLGGSVGIEAVHSLRTHAGTSFGASVAFTVKLSRPNAIGQVGVNGWPSDLYRGPATTRHRLKAWELFIAIALYPWTVALADLGLYVLLAADSFDNDIAARGALGVSVQVPIDRAWALRYQLGCTSETNFTNAGVVSTLAVDLVVPYI